MSVIANFPTSYFPASHAGGFGQIFHGGFVAVPDTTAPGGTTTFHSRDLFEPWMRDVQDQQNCVQVIIIVNYTGYTPTLSGTPYHDGASLISQPILPDDTTVNVIPPGCSTDRATYLGMGRFVQGDGSIFYGSAIAMTLNARQGAFSQDMGIFVSGSVRGGCGLDVCANMANVDPRPFMPTVRAIRQPRWAPGWRTVRGRFMCRRDSQPVFPRDQSVRRCRPAGLCAHHGLRGQADGG